MGITLGTPLADTYTLELINAGTDEVLKDSNGSIMTVTVYGSDSKKYRKVRAKVLSDNEEKRPSKRRKSDVLMEEITATCIESWNIEENGKKIPYTVENALEVFEGDRPIYEQIIEAQTDRSLFFIRPAKI